MALLKVDKAYKCAPGEACACHFYRDFTLLVYERCRK